jgi:hypothetical protein
MVTQPEGYGNMRKGVTKCHPGREHKAFGLCESCWKKKYRTKNGKGVRSAERKAKRVWRDLNREKLRGYMLKYNYGITLTEYNKMFIEQGGCCAICGQAQTSKALSVDHNHSTQKIRQLLCVNCNTLVGVAESRPDIIKKMGEYLEKHG